MYPIAKQQLIGKLMVISKHGTMHDHPKHKRSSNGTTGFRAFKEKPCKNGVVYEWNLSYCSNV